MSATATASPSDAAALQLELRRLRKEVADLTRANAMLSDAAEQFAGALAHDVKNPLAAIKINVQSLKRRIERGGQLEPEYCLERLGRIDAALDQTLEHIASARARLNTSGAHDAPLRREPVDLVRLVRELVDEHNTQGPSRRVQLESRAKVLAGEWDPPALRRAFGHLLDNALKFSPDASEITLVLAREDERAVISLTDRGLGIPARDLNHVCERFYRGENVVGRFKGAGLGLFEAKTAIAQHQGRLVIDSQEGSGSTFTVHLPLR
jgi:signal transduction histidine kinase